MKNFKNKIKSAALAIVAIFSINCGMASVDGWVDDATITAKIKSAYVIHPAMSAWNIGVTTTDGNVKLSGHANSKTQVEAAVSIASDIEGVQDVDTAELSVEKSEDPVKDYTISAKIKAKLLADKAKHIKIDVESVNGNVYLSGKVKNADDEKKAIEIASKVNHVESVTSFLTLKDKDKS